MSPAASNPDAAQTAAVRTLLEPASIAIIGASDKSRWSVNVFDNLRSGGYAGKVHLVNPRGAIAHGQQCATSCAAVGERIDVGLIMTPGTAVAAAVADLAAAGARSAVIITAGFSETGAAGQALQEQVRAVAAAKGVRLLGPHCLGYINFTNRAYVLDKGRVVIEGNSQQLVESGKLEEVFLGKLE